MKKVIPNFLADITIQDDADREILEEVTKVYGELPVQGQTVLDMGAHIGMASRVFCAGGAERVIAIEPDPRNYARLVKTAEGWPIHPINAAVTPDGVNQITLYLSKTSHSNRIQPVRGREKVTVQGYSLQELLDTWSPTVVKCDIEFTEYELPLLRALPSTVKVLAMELHSTLVFGKPDEKILKAVERLWELESAIRAQGFSRIYLLEKKMYGTVVGVCSNYERA